MTNYLLFEILKEYFGISKEEYFVLEALDEEYDILGTTDFENLLLEHDFDSVLSAIVLDAVPGRTAFTNKDQKVVSFDKINKQIVRIEDCVGSFHIDEEIKKMNEIINHAKGAV